jgi:SulP family sulfate permease
VAKRADFWIATAAILGVASVGVLAGVVIGVVLSVGWLVYVSAHPAMPVLGREPGTSAFRSLEEYPDGETYPGLFVVRLDGELYFVTADALEDRLREAVVGAEEPVASVIVDFAGVNFIDSQGSAKVGELTELAGAAGVSLRLARIKPAVLRVLRADGVAEQIGEDRIHANVDRAVKAELDQAPPA